MPRRSEEHSAEESGNVWFADARSWCGPESIDVKAHGFTIDALVDVFVADAFHATAAQAT